MAFLYGLFSLIDWAVYSLCSLAMRLIIIVANYNFFGEEQISELSNRVYVVLGVFVLFKIAISCVQYMVNPDVFDDKDKGMAGILKKTVICMLLLVITRPVFTFAIRMQNIVVSTIPSLVMGNGISNYSLANDDANQEIDDISNLVATTTLRAFVTLKTENGQVLYPGEENNINSINTFREHILDGCGTIFNITGESCHYDYMILISTAAGIFLLYILLSMVLDIGIRTIKLGIIQILAPIPIGSYIVSKDKLNKFVKLAVKVYLDLFVRLIVVFFIIFFVREVVKSLGSGGIYIGDGYPVQGLEFLFLKVVIIIALFMFAKKAPQFICDVLGIEGGGFGDLKDMFTRAGAMAGTTGAMLTAGVSNFAANKDKSFGTRLRSAIAGSTSAGYRGTRAALHGKNMKEAFRTGHEGARQARIDRQIDQAKGLKGMSGLKTRAKVAVQDFMGLTSTASLANDTIKATDTLIQDNGALKGKYMELLGRYGHLTNINHSQDAKKGFSALIGRYADAITDPAYGSDMTPEMMDIISRMQTGGKVSYTEVASLRNAIRSSDALKGSVKLQQFANELEDGHETMKAITAEFMLESMAKKEDYMDGVAAKDKVFRRGSAYFDKDLDLRIKTVEQHIAENAAGLDGIEAKVRNPDGTITKRALHGATDLLSAFNTNFKGLEGGAKAKGNEARESLATDQEAAAREANRRKSDNKKQNSGK